MLPMRFAPIAITRAFRSVGCYPLSTYGAGTGPGGRFASGTWALTARAPQATARIIIFIYIHSIPVLLTVISGIILMRQLLQLQLQI